MPEKDNPLKYEIHSSVGKGGVNQAEDVETVQNMLRLASMIESQPALDPGPIDGVIDATNEAQDDTVRAIQAFQARLFNHPDGLIDVNKRTWNELMKVLEGDPSDDSTTSAPTSTTTPVAGGEFFFPFPQVPALNWTEGIRRFGARRSQGKRAHAGCDLYFPVGTIIHAITSGIVTRGPAYFYEGTYSLEIDHGSFLARYGEIQQQALVKTGDRVTPGQPIAKVGRLTGMTNSMLHLELYDKSAQGPLTVTNSQTKRTSDGIPFMRRRDLLDPTARLNEWKSKLP